MTFKPARPRGVRRRQWIVSAAPAQRAAARVSGGGQGERRWPGRAAVARASGGGQGERRWPRRAAVARASGQGRVALRCPAGSRRSGHVGLAPVARSGRPGARPTRNAVARRGTDVPWRAGHRRISPDITGAVGDATPENRCKAAIPKVGSGGPHGVRVPLGAWPAQRFGAAARSGAGTLGSAGRAFESALARAQR